MSLPLVLRLDVTGKPIKWIPWEQAACLYSRDMVAWAAGRNTFRLRGGHSRLTGLRTILEVNSIIAVRGEYQRRYEGIIPPLNNRELFRRDRNTCMYCGREFQDIFLTRDHVIPVYRGGRDCWSNVVAACRRCNTRKGGRTPEGASMPLLAVPYVPNVAEYLVLRNRRILADQMEFLRAQFKGLSSRWPP